MEQHTLGHQGQGERGSPPKSYAGQEAAPTAWGEQHQTPQDLGSQQLGASTVSWGGLILSTDLVLAASVAPRRSPADGVITDLTGDSQMNEARADLWGKITWV